MSQDLFLLPGPQVSSVLEYSRDPLGFMTRCAREFGEIIPLRFRGEIYCLLTNPDHISEVLKEHLLFIKGKDLRILRGLLGDGLLTSEGSFWQRQRRLTQPVFHQERINAYSKIMVDYTERMLQCWRVGEVRDIHQEMMRLTLDIVMKTIFNQDVNNREASVVAKALDRAMSWFLEQNGETQSILTKIQSFLGRNKSDRQYQKAIAGLDETIYAMIDHRRCSGVAGEDLLSMLMQVEAEDGSRMSDRSLRDEVITLMLAGHETTANALSWTWMLLADHPHVWAKLRAELETILDGRTPAISDLPQLPYSNMIIKEAMRLYPPVTDISREATRDCEIGGYSIPAGTTLIASQWVMHRDPRYWNNPEKFIPERWADDLEKRLPRGVYFPFGDGPRICIGKSFAQIEAVLILATIAQKFQLEPIEEQKIELQPSITLRPKHGIKVQLN